MLSNEARVYLATGLNGHKRRIPIVHKSQSKRWFRNEIQAC